MLFRRLGFRLLALSVVCLSAVPPARADAVDDVRTMENTFQRQFEAGDYAAAEQTVLKFAEYVERYLKSNPRLRAVPYMDASVLYYAVGRYADAATMGHKALDIVRPVLGADDPIIASILTNIASAKFQLDDVEAEKLYRRALAIQSAHFGRQSEEYAAALENLAIVIEYSGRYSESNPMFIEVLRTRIALDDGGEVRIGGTMNNLGFSLMAQRRYDEARSYLEESLAILKTKLGPSHPALLPMHMNLARIQTFSGRFVDAEKHVDRIEKITAERVGADDPWVVANPLRALLYAIQGKPQDAEPILRKRLEILEARNGTPQAKAEARGDLGDCYNRLGQFDKALEALDVAVELGVKAQAYDWQLLRWYAQRALAREGLGRRRDALADIDAAVGHAERERLRFSGGEAEQSEAFQGLDFAYRAGAAIALADQNFAKAVDYSERVRARALVDQMATAHVDLLAGLPPAEAAELQAGVVRAEKGLLKAKQEFDAVLEKVDPETPEGKKALADPARALQIARRRLADARSAATNKSPIYRKSLEREFQPATLDAVQAWCRDTKSLALYYFVDDTSATILWIDPTSDKVDTARLEVSDGDAAILGVASGPLDAGKLARIISTEKDGIVARLKTLGESAKAHGRLETLGRILLPASVQSILKAGKLERMVIVPQGALVFLPFETLLMQKKGEEMTYLLDVAPPTAYSPSFTTLLNLVRRKAPPAIAGRSPVLTLGDVDYLAPGAAPTSVRLGPPSASAEYSRVSSRPDPLKFSGPESDAVAKAFLDRNIEVGQLKKGLATEGNVRFNAPGRRILHFACHGNSSESYGNAFGALAFGEGPSARSSAADDGYLTVAEIYPLDLGSCELAILSACVTNVGPLQKGEGAWTISRAFLVAGARRVVSSFWPVNDYATADLMGRFANSVARGMADDKLDCARALHEAKRALRNNKATSDPKFWAPFVLVGPQ